MFNFKLSYYTVVTDCINEESNNPKRIIYSTRSGKSIVISERILHKITENDFTDIHDDILKTLLDGEFIVPEEDNEFADIMEQNRTFIQEPDIASFTIQPGANCQLGCHYCGQSHTKNYLSQHLYEKLIARVREITSRKQYRILSISWYGGEPLMALKQIRDLSPELIRIAEDNKLIYAASMITNGLSLKPEIFTELVQKYQIKSFQITIDGMKEHHDQRRITKTGEPTYDIIFENVKKCASLPLYKEEGCNIAVRCNIDKSNYESIMPFVEILTESGLKDKITMQFAPIVDWGDVLASKNSLKKEEFAEVEIDWLMQLLKAGYHTDLIPGRSYAPCMVVNPEAEVYDAFGNIFPCYEFPYTEKYQTSDHIVGNLANPAETYKYDVHTRSWFDDVEAGKSWCKKCKFFPVCGGGCPKQWLSGTPACPSFKFNMEDRLVLQYIVDKNKLEEVL